VLNKESAQQPGSVASAAGQRDVAKTRTEPILPSSAYGSGKLIENYYTLTNFVNQD
jgi:hypothetical protein